MFLTFTYKKIVLFYKSLIFVIGKEPRLPFVKDNRMFIHYVCWYGGGVVAFFLMKDGKWWGFFAPPFFKVYLFLRERDRQSQAAFCTVSTERNVGPRTHKL